LKGLRLIWEKNPELAKGLSAESSETTPAPEGGGKRDPKKAAR